MPLYEYICDNCRKQFTLLVGVTAEEEKSACPHCGSAKYHKIISRVFRGRPADASLENFAEEDFGNLEDPTQARHFAKRMGEELGEELGEGFEEEVEAAIEETGGTAEET
jgi:putative FmdB family regulatory protein